jgi:hypothetical protein
MRERTAETDRRYYEAQNTAFAGEHVFAYVCALIAGVLAAAGVLEGFGVIDIAEAGRGAQEGAPNAGDNQASFLDGVLFLIPAATFAFLSFYFHASDHHRMRDVRTVDDKDKAAWGAEHAGAILMGLTATVLAVLGILVGFDAFSSGHTAEDGILWQLASLVPAVLSCALHSVRHHQLSVEEDYIVRIVEDRVGTRGTMTGTTTGNTTGEMETATRRTTNR